MEVLKLTVKREIFDNISDGKQDFVYLEANGYWIKRLAENKLANFNKLKATQSFKKYDEIEITCLNDKINTTFDGIFTGDNDGVIGGDNATGIVVKLGKIIGDDKIKTFADKKDFLGDKAFTEETPSVAAEPNIDVSEEVDEMKGKDDVDDKAFTEETPSVAAEPNTGTVEETDEIKGKDDIDDEEELADEIADEEDDAETNEVKDKCDYDFNILINDLIDCLEESGSIIVVNRPSIIIANGKIFGTNKRIKTNNEEEIRINIGKEVIEDTTGDDVKFLVEIESFLYKYCSSGNVFVWKNESNIVNDEDGRRFVLRIAKLNSRNR